MSARPLSVYRDALTRITAAAFQKRGAPSFASIPARPEHDADLLLADALDELERLRWERDTPIPAEETIAGLKAEIERLGFREAKLMDGLHNLLDALPMPGCEEIDSAEALLRGES